MTCPSGVPVLDPVAVLSSDLLARIAKDFERLPGLVIFDTPPVSLFSDALGVGVQCDAVILALDAGRTRLRPTRNTITALERAGAPTLGIVVNRIKSRREHYGAYK